MANVDSNFETSGDERRRFPRFPILGRMTLAIEDESIGESIGIGEAGDLSLGGVRVLRLPAHTHVQPGDRLGLLLMSDVEALSLHGEVVHHGTQDSFGVEFRDLSTADGQRISSLLQNLSH